MQLYLASGSPRRREILNLMRLPYKIVTIEANETLPQGIDMRDAGCLLAARKATAASAKLNADKRLDADTLILAADTLVYLDGMPLGKPHTPEKALAMLLSLSGKKHEVCTGVCLYANGKIHTAADVTAVTMCAYDEEEARAYIATKEPLDKAGAYGVQGIGAVLVERLSGDFFTVMGLSPRVIRNLLADAGYSYFNLLI